MEILVAPGEQNCRTNAIKVHGQSAKSGIPGAHLEIFQGSVKKL